MPRTTARPHLNDDDDDDDEDDSLEKDDSVDDTKASKTLVLPIRWIGRGWELFR